ncbi:hypothetical protein BMS3Bbin04_01840 [bacterium BMS3Bbin04]|nr:hypothetical protein BMS3Bbin04_01840 [bacterium BMS3Bbin04]
MRISMRHVVIFLLALSLNVVAFAQEYPDPRGFVNDFAQVMSGEEVRQLNALCLEVKQKATIELAFVTMDSIPGGDAISMYATELGHRWGVGTKGTDRGALVLYSTGSADGNRQVFIATGYGLEEYIPDGYAGKIRDQILVPYLRENRVLDAFAATAVTIVQRVEPSIQLSGASQYQGNRSPQQGEGPSLFSLIFMVGIFILMMSTRFGRMMLFGMLLGSLMGGHRGRWGGGSGFGGGGFGGGFGGFGGGGFGGGGAGGSF